MTHRPFVPLMVLLAVGLLPGCRLLPSVQPTEAIELKEVLQDYSVARSESARADDDDAQRKLARARNAVEAAALHAAVNHRDHGRWFQARQVLDKALEEMPDSKMLLDAREEIETERQARLRYNDCRLGASRARFLSDKARLLEARGALESKDFLQDWLTRRERAELEQLGTQLRDCSVQALAERRLDLAEDSLSAAAAARGEAFVADERRLLDQLKNPTERAAPPPEPRAAKKVAEDSPQLKARRTRGALQSAMTRGDLRQAKVHLTQLRALEGDTAELLELEQAIDSAIGAHIAEAHERANTLYRERQIVQARDLWQKILELDANDTQARANLERAERVLKKLEELQGISSPEIQPAVPVPPSPAPAP